MSSRMLLGVIEASFNSEGSEIKINLLSRLFTSVIPDRDKNIFPKHVFIYQLFEM